MLLGASAPPRFSEFTWSITYPGHAPEDFPVAGHGCDCLKACLAAGLRLILPALSRVQDAHLDFEERWVDPDACDREELEREALWLLAWSAGNNRTVNERTQKRRSMVGSSSEFQVRFNSLALKAGPTGPSGYEQPFHSEDRVDFGFYRLYSCTYAYRPDDLEGCGSRC